MPVSKKMIDAIEGVPEFTTEYEYDPETGVDGTSGDIDNPEEVAQAVVNAAWTKFDLNDESTWPKTRLTSGGSLWLVWFDEDPNIKWFNFMRWVNEPEDWEDAVYYANPHDLLHVSEVENDKS